MPNRTRKLAESGLLLGISAVLLLLGTYSVIGGLAILVIPVPFILLAVRWSLRDSLLIAGLFALLGVILTGIPGAASGLIMALMGAVMGLLYKRYRTAVPALLGGAGAFLASLILLLAVASFVMGVDLQQQIRSVGQMVLDMVREMNLPEGMTPEQFVEAQLRLFVTVLPVSLVMMSFLVSGINHWVASLVSARTGRRLPGLPPFREWSFPRSLMYYYFVALLLSLVFDQSLMETFWGQAVLNVTYLLHLVFIIQGLSFCAFWFHLKGWKILTPILVAALFIFHYAANILSLLGILDLGIGLRKRLESRK